MHFVITSNAHHLKSVSVCVSLHSKHMSACAVGLLHGLVCPLAVYSFTEAAAIIPAEMDLDTGLLYCRQPMSPAT